MKSTKIAYDLLSKHADNYRDSWSNNPYDRSLYEAEIEFARKHLPPVGAVMELGCGREPCARSFGGDALVLAKKQAGVQ
ncbi:hypothetical protein ACFL6Y_10460 [Elusimicrobiota bacterium]